MIYFNSDIFRYEGNNIFGDSATMHKHKLSTDAKPPGSLFIYEGINLTCYIKSLRTGVVVRFIL